MNLEGELVVHLPWNGHRVQQVTVQSSRPFAAMRLLAGMRPREIVATVPLLFSICGGAQRAAAAGALAAAGAPAVSSSGAGGELDVILETVQECFWRLLIDWPEAMGREPLAPPVAAVRRRIAAMPRGPDGTLSAEHAPAMYELGAELDPDSPPRRPEGSLHDTWENVPMILHRA